MLFALLRPLTRAKEADAARAAFDANVYRDQLAEIESDRERGLLSEADAEAARIEIARRLLGTDADNVAYLTMGGGCQGCAMSRLTMVQGVEASIKDAFPEVTRVVDATDHSVGAMPYYT